MVKVTLIVLLMLFPAVVPAAPPGPPQPPEPSRVVPRHVQAVIDRLGKATATDWVTRQVLAEARTSADAAKSALGANALRAADEWAASADELLRAADQKEHGPQPDPADILSHIGVFTAALATVREARVHALLALAQTVADEARREAAYDEPGAGWEAMRAEAIARAAAHVAIAVDPSLAPILPAPPRHPKPPGAGTP